MNIVNTIKDALNIIIEDTSIYSNKFNQIFKINSNKLKDEFNDFILLILEELIINNKIESLIVNDLKKKNLIIILNFVLEYLIKRKFFYIKIKNILKIFLKQKITNEDYNIIKSIMNYLNLLDNIDYFSNDILLMFNKVNSDDEIIISKIKMIKQNLEILIDKSKLKKPLNVKTGPVIKIRSLIPKIIDDNEEKIYNQKNITKNLKEKKKRINKSLIKDIKDETNLNSIKKSKFDEKQQNINKKKINQFADRIQQSKKEIEKEITMQIQSKRIKKKSKRKGGNLL